MDEEDNQSETHQRKPKSKFSIRILGCFGFSQKPSSLSRKTNLKIPEKDNNNSSKRWFSRSTFQFKKSGCKTVPVVDSTLSTEKSHSKKNSTLKKSKLKKITSDDSFKQRNPACQDEIPTKSAPLVTTNPKQTSEVEACEENVIHGNGKRLDHVVNSPRKLSFRRKKDTTATIRKGSASQPGSPKARPESNQTIPRSTSFPAGPVQLNAVSDRPEHSRVSAKKGSKLEMNGSITGKTFDPVIGMSIVMVTLIMMVLWGRLCAILCTCAWLYFVPRLRVNYIGTNEIEKVGSVLAEPDFSSKEYKKRVVFEGFLERSHRSVPVL